MSDTARIPVAVLGATGMVGQRFIALLANHPWFAVAVVAGSERSLNQRYGDAVTWRLPSAPPMGVLDLPVVAPDAEFSAPVVFSALPASVAETVEPLLAARGHVVFSNASSHRMAEDVPLLIPEVNGDHLALLNIQQARRGWPGLLITNPNCSTIEIVLALKPLADAYGIRRLHVTTLQAISGAGYPGVASYDIVDNVIPYIGQEEEKIERETRKLLGTYQDGAVVPAPMKVSVQCNRVAVREGHLACISVELGRAGLISADLIDAWQAFRPEPQERKLPSAPQPPILVRQEQDRPQPLFDRDAGGGMAVTVGRVRPCPILGHKFIVLGHNTIRGAAGASVLNAEMLLARGLLGAHQRPASLHIEKRGNEMTASEQDEAEPQIAFQGERGAYGEEAVVAYFGTQVAPVPKKSFAEVFEAVASGESDAGLLPIENSQAGSINEVYDLLRSSQLFVTGEICRPINHCLLCLPGQTLSQIKRVLSHPQALAQSDAYLRSLDVEVVAAYDTAGSAKLIREQGLLGVAAVASARAAELYQLEVLASGIQTIKDNYTRFIVVERQSGLPPTGQAKTMLMLATAHRPGALYQALGEFAARNINLLKLESRPSREKPWEYIFYLDIEGAPQEAPVAQALAALKSKTAFIQALGTFLRDPTC